MKKLKVLSFIIILLVCVFCFSACEFGFNGNRVLEVKGNSMAPTMNIGDKIVVKKLEEYKNGDIILFTYNQNITVCHRIIFTLIENEEVYYICKGDNIQNLDGTDADGKWRDDARYIENLVYNGANHLDIADDCGTSVQLVTKDQIQGKVVNIIKK